MPAPSGFEVNQAPPAPGGNERNQAQERSSTVKAVFVGTAKEAQALLESLAYCQRVVAVGQVCGKPTPCEEHKPAPWNPRWSSERYGDTERAAFGKERG